MSILKVTVWVTIGPASWEVAIVVPQNANKTKNNFAILMFLQCSAVYKVVVRQEVVATVYSQSQVDAAVAQAELGEFPALQRYVLVT